jgi:hypothetical protein
MAGFFTLFLAIQAAAPTSGVARPDDAILAAHRTACTDFQDVERARAQAVRDGWVAFDMPYNDRPGRWLSRRLGEYGEFPLRVAVDRLFTLRKTVAGRPLVLMLIDERYPGSERRVRQRMCLVRDYGATAQFDPAFVTRWTDRAPARIDNAFGDHLIWVPRLYGSSADERAGDETSIETGTTLTYISGSQTEERGLEIGSNIEDWAG